MAYGTLTHHGTIFVGSSTDQGILKAMLESMVGIGDGPPDQSITVTRPLTGSYHVTPSADRLASFD